MTTDAQPLPGPADLIGTSWNVFKQRFLTYWGVCLLGALWAVLPAAAIIALGWAVGLLGASVRGPAMGLAALAAMLAGIYGVARMGAGLLTALSDDTVLAAEALKRGGGKALGLIGLSLWMGFLLTGGYLLLVVPGVLFHVWFFFAPFALVSEGARGLDALRVSRDRVRGRFWPVAVRLLVMWILFSLLSAIPVVGQVLGLLLFPWPLLHARVLFETLRGETPPAAPAKSATGWKAGVVCAGLAGYLLFPLVLMAMFGSVIMASVAVLKPRLEQMVRDGSLEVVVRQVFTRAAHSTGGPGAPEEAIAGAAAEAALAAASSMPWTLDASFPSDVQATFDEDHSVGGDPNGVAWTGSEFLVCNREKPWGFLRFSKAGGSVRKVKVRDFADYNDVAFVGVTWNGSNPVSLCPYEGLFVPNGSQTAVLLDPVDLHAVKSWGVPKLLGGIAWDGVNYWAVVRKNTQDSDEEALIYQLDGTTLKVLRQFPSPIPGCQGAVWAAGHLWLVDVFTDVMVVVDVASEQVVRTYHLPFNYASGVAFDGENFWVTEYSSKRIHRLDPAQRGIERAEVQVSVSVTPVESEAPPSPPVERKATPPAATPAPVRTPAPAAPPKNKSASPAPTADSVWTEMLKSSDWMVRRDAVKTIGDIGTRKDLPAIRKLLKDPNAEVRAAAQAALRKLER